MFNCFGFLVCHQLVPHLVPNSPRVPLRNVSWGLGVCAVLVRSVSPCRLVLEVRLFPCPPCAVLAFCPSSVFAFFFLLPFRVYPASTGCVCVYHLNRCKTSLFFFLLSSPFLILILMQGVDAWSGSHPPTKTLPFHGDMTKGRLCHVPAFFGHSKGPSSEPQPQYYTIATI